MSDKEKFDIEKYKEEQKKRLAKMGTKAWLAETEKEVKKAKEDIERLLAEKELDEQTEKTRKLLEKQSALLDLQIKETNTELEIAEYKKKAKLPKTTVEERLKIIHNVQAEILNKRRELEVQRTGNDPEPKFLGKSEDGKESIIESYSVCWNCKKVFKTFKNAIFCSEKCRFDFVSKHQKQKPLIQEEWLERDCGSWDWERIGSYQDETGQHGIFRRVFK
jgi:hypothetical protein